MGFKVGSKIFFESDEDVYVCKAIANIKAKSSNVCLLFDCNPTDSEMRELQGRF